MKRLRWLRSAGGAAFLGVGLGRMISISQAGRADSGGDLNLQLAPKDYPYTFAVDGDTRFTHVPTASDAAKRQAIVQKLTKERPDFIVINGDVVYNGFDKQDWSVFDSETEFLRDEGVKIFPALGNHDIRGGEDGLRNYFAHFPDLKGHHWYSLRYGNSLLLSLDSMSDDTPGSPQGKWLASKLNSIPADVDFVFLSLHHPLYTKSSEHLMGGGHSTRPEEQQLAHFLKQKAAGMKQKIVVVAGHVHNYERYERGGVMYITAGGGGAPPYMIDRSPNDFYNQPGPTYHYCTVKVDHGKLHFEMHKLEANGDFKVEDKFDLSTGK